MKYLNPQFSVGMPSSQQYRDNFDEIFRCKSEHDDHRCQLKRNHDGEHTDGEATWK